jgi:hypothetical protein
MTLANFHRHNPNAHEGGSKAFSHSFRIQRIVGQSLLNCSLGPITNFARSEYYGTSFVPDQYRPSYNGFYEVTWDPLPFGASFTLTTDFATDLVVQTSTTSARIYFLSEGNQETTRTCTLTAYSSYGTTSSSTVSLAPCFLAGSLVHMSDGSTKCIEDVQVGDQLLGAFGEINAVLALHRPLLGNAQMCTINAEHSTTSHHPHISLDKRFYCGNPDLVLCSTYGRKHIVLDSEGNQVERMLHGLNKERILPLHLGIELKTVEGSRPVQTLEMYTLPEDTQLYNLVVDGSHTYHVDGYAVTGWPSELDFDYDTWTAIGLRS